jgi:hypothetical protein
MLVDRRLVWPIIAVILAGIIMLAALPTLLPDLANEIVPGRFHTLEKVEAACGEGNIARVEKITPTSSSDAGFVCQR